MELAPDQLEAARAWMLEQWPKEGCGLIDGQGRFVPAVNLAVRSSDCFAMAPHLVEAHDAIAVVHSHPGGWRCPSLHDMRQQKVTALPWGIFWTDGETAEPPFWWDGRPNDPEGQGFRSGVTDCINLVRFELGRAGIEVADPPRDPTTKAELAEQLLGAARLVLGFTAVIGEPQPLDVVVFRYRNGRGMHLGVLQADGSVRHHDGLDDHQAESLPRTTPWPLMLRTYRHVATYRHKDLGP